MLMCLFKENKFVSNVDVISMDIEKRTYKEMKNKGNGRTFWSVKKDTCFLFLWIATFTLNVAIITVYSLFCRPCSGSQRFGLEATFYILHYNLGTKF